MDAHDDGNERQQSFHYIAITGVTGGCYRRAPQLCHTL
jgi:hypothetical protein